jgi:histidinol phosphatase-like PHP family hydrolase
LSVKLKLDLHTHVFEEFVPLAPRLITVKSVFRIVEKIKSAGLDGVAITEHGNKEFGYRVKEIVDDQFKGEVLIIPGKEIEEYSIHFIELDLSPDGKKTFRFLAHPGYPSELPQQVARFGGIEIENAMHNWHINKAAVREFATKNKLILLHNSDAHYLRDLGKCYNEIALEDLG